MNIPWTDDQNAMLTKLYTAGLPFSMIVDAINGHFGTSFSRNAAIGRVHRMGLPARPSPIRPKSEEHEPERIVRRPKFKAEPFKSRAAKVGSLHKTIVEVVMFAECHWADDEPNAAGLTTFCGHPTCDGSNWCEAHQKIAWQPHQARAKQSPIYRETRRRAA